MKTIEQQQRTQAKTKILVVDDHPIVRQGLTQLIDHETDLTVTAQAETALIALNVVDSRHIDLAIIDISLIGSDGIDLAREIKSRHPNIPILMLTMHDEPLFAERAFLAGAQGYILKREAPGKIIDAIRIILDGKRYVTQEVAQKLSENNMWHDIDKESPSD